MLWGVAGRSGRIGRGPSEIGLGLFPTWRGRCCATRGKRQVTRGQRPPPHGTRGSAWVADATQAIFFYGADVSAFSDVATPCNWLERETNT